LRKVSLVVVSITALLAFAAVALAQTNTYTTSGKIASGGTKKKPKPVAVKFGYTVGEANGNLASPVKTYKIHFNGLKGDPTAVKGKCAASKLNAMTPAPDDSTCPANSKVGTGTVNALVGTAGNAIGADTAKCKLDLRIYAGTKKSLTLFLHGEQPSCIASINQAIDAKLTTDATGGALTFTVPPSLLHPVEGLDVAVTDVSSDIKKIGKGTKGLFTSTGCKGKRAIEVTFTAETGEQGKAQSTAGKC
jgi:hypothetical protein